MTRPVWVNLPRAACNSLTADAQEFPIRRRPAVGELQCAEPAFYKLMSMLENHQQPDGSVLVPKALQPYLGGRDVLEPVR